MTNLKIEFTDKEITAWGGIAILQKMMEKMSFAEVLRFRKNLKNKFSGLKKSVIYEIMTR